MGSDEDLHSLSDILHYNADRDLRSFLNCADRDFGRFEAGPPYNLLEDMNIKKQGQQQLFVDPRREILEIRS